MPSIPLEIDELARVMRTSAQGCPRVLVGIDGPGGSGKSTLATQLVEALGDACLIHGDDFYLPSSRRDERLGEIGSLFDLPRLLEQVVAPGASGSAIRYQRHNWGTDALGEWTGVPDGVPIVVEGVYCLSEAMRSFYTYKIWCRADPAVRLARGLQRDGETARSSWVDLWMPLEDDYVAKQNPQLISDLVLDSSSDQGTGETFRVVQQ